MGNSINIWGSSMATCLQGPLSRRLCDLQKALFTTLPPCKLMSKPCEDREPVTEPCQWPSTNHSDAALPVTGTAAPSSAAALAAMLRDLLTA
eukprot:s1254_g19.t1